MSGEEDPDAYGERPEFEEEVNNRVGFEGSEGEGKGDDDDDIDQDCVDGHAEDLMSICKI